jgi:phage FluMu protein Com
MKDVRCPVCNNRLWRHDSCAKYWCFKCRDVFTLKEIWIWEGAINERKQNVSKDENHI